MVEELPAELCVDDLVALDFVKLVFVKSQRVEAEE